jgi:hypothetical protein
MSTGTWKRRRAYIFSIAVIALHCEGRVPVNLFSVKYLQGVHHPVSQSVESFSQLWPFISFGLSAAS